MALPYLFQCGFEDGTLGAFDSLSNGNTKVSYKHYSELARTLQFPDAIPYKGSFAAHFDLSLGTTTAYFEEATGAVVAANTAAAFRCYFWASSNLTMAASDTFDLLIWQSAGPVSEMSINILNNAGTLQLRGGDTGAGTWRSTDLITNTWHCLELLINTGTGVNATCSFYVDDQLIGAQITGITSAAMSQARVGAQNIDAGTTAGHLLFDEIVFDDTRVGPLARRFDQTRVLTQSGHAVLGPASIVEADILLSSANDETLVLYDTDNASILDLSKRVAVFGQQNPIYVEKGLYCVLGGTSPVAFIKVQDCRDMNASQIVALGLKSHP